MKCLAEDNKRVQTGASYEGFRFLDRGRQAGG